jgi:hypothetical protein
MMDHLPEQSNQLLLVAPSALAGRAFLDRMGRFAVELRGTHTLRLTGRLRPGLYQMRMLIRSGCFDVVTLMLPLIEWPGQRKVLAGPFDFDHTTYRMAVPTFRATVNGANQGLVWSEVPSPEDMAARRIRALWGIEIETDGETVIELTITDEDRERLRWTDLAEMDLVADDRGRLPLPASVSRQPAHPRLLAGEADFERMRGAADPISQRLRARLLHFAESGRDGTYDYRTLTLALLARMTGDARWQDEAVTRAMALVGMTSWGYHDIPEIMGWNCDRDAGNRMFELSVVFDWLHERLSPAQRQSILDKLAYHAEIAYRMTLLQKNYWYHRCNEAHGMGLWCGLAAASAVLLGHHPRAEKWLEWAMAGFADAAGHLQTDGIATWFVFNISWHVYTLAILESVLGKPFEPDFPFFRNFPARVLQVSNPDAVDPALANHLLYLARRYRSPRIQADALRSLGVEFGAPEDRYPDAIDPLAVLFFDPGLRAGTRQPVYSIVCAERGVVSCRASNGSRFTMACGTGATAAHHAAFNFINRTWYGPANSGSFHWTLDWVDDKGRARSSDFQPAILKSYRADTKDANLITIDGRGHFLEGRWLGSTLPLKQVSFLEHCAGDGVVAYACGNSSDAYAGEFEVQHLLREWVFFHETGILVMRDRVRTARPRRFAWHLHGTWEPWEWVAPFHYFTTTNGRRLVVRALATAVDGGDMSEPGHALSAQIERPEFVPTYPTGVNVYRSLDWQPELRPKKINIPPYMDLQFAPTAGAATWDLVTVMGVDADLCAAAFEAGPGWVRVGGLPGGGEVVWPVTDRVVLPGTPYELTAAAAARPSAAADWRSFHTAAWRVEGGEWTHRQPPADLLWRNGGGPETLSLVAGMPRPDENLKQEETSS